MDFIVEIGNSHEGSVGIAQSFIDMAKSSGANCVKFQMHLAEFESMPFEPFRKYFSVQDKSRIDYWQRVNFIPEHWIFLAEYCEKIGIEFLCTPFSVEAAKFLFVNGLVKRWKVGSGDAVNFPLIDYLISTNLPLIISTGLVSWDEILILKTRLLESNSWHNTTLMHCISAYPTPLEKVAINLISDLQSLGCKVGISDHSGNIAVSLKAISLGVSSVEFHMTCHKDFFGPDTKASLLPEDIRKVIDISNAWDVLEKKKIAKAQVYEDATPLRKIFRKGVYWSCDLKSGEIITLDNLKFRKPVEVFDAIDFEKILKRKTRRQVFMDKPVMPEDLE